MLVHAALFPLVVMDVVLRVGSGLMLYEMKGSEEHHATTILLLYDGGGSHDGLTWRAS